MPTEIECIERTLRRNMEDLHIVFTSDVENIDLEYYNSVQLALLQAEEKIKAATVIHDQKVKDKKNENAPRKYEGFKTH